jgi:hypothetical protein
MRQHDHGDEIGWFAAHGIDPFMLAIGYYGEYCEQHPRPFREARKPRPKIVVRRKGQHKKAWPKRKFGK